MKKNKVEWNATENLVWIMKREYMKGNKKHNPE